jgi:uncharacterized phage protein gp47/JayE
MPFDQPTLEQIVDRIEADIASQLGLSALLPRSLETILARALGGGAHMLHFNAGWVARQIFPDTADSDRLDDIGGFYKVTRKAPAFATGAVLFTGTNDTLIPLGTIAQRADGVQFATDAAATIVGGQALVEVTAVVAGIAGDTDTATTLSLSSPIAGVDPSPTVESPGISGGAEEEADSDYVDRILERVRLIPQGGANRDYVGWAKEVPGVTRAWALQTQGLGTIDVTFVVDNDPTSLIPDATKLAEVEAYLDDGRRPATANLTVFAPATQDLDPSITLVPDTSDIRTSVQAALEDFVRRETNPGGTMTLTKINEAISTAALEQDHVLVAPVADVTPAAGEIILPGTITWL